MSQSTQSPNLLTVRDHSYVPAVVAAVLSLVLCGCPTHEDKPKDSTELPLKGVTLKLAVVGDPAMAEAIAHLRGEWSAQTGSELTVSEMTESDLDAAASIEADAVIAASWQIGPLAERKAIVPLPNQQAFVRAEAEGWSDLFELPRLREAMWDGRVMAVPFGSPLLVVYYRADLMEQLGRSPPKTWPEYCALSALLADRAKLGDAAPPADAPWAGAIEPLAPGWAGLTFLAHAAALAKSRSHYSTLFDIDSFEPLIATTPFVKALDDMLEVAKSGPKDATSFDPAAARAAFWRGEAGMVLTWPSAAKAANAPAEKPPANIRVTIAELPGSKGVFDRKEKLWVRRNDERQWCVPLISMAGRDGMISGQSKNPEAALQLLLWLSGKTHSPVVCAVSPATTVFRKSHVRSPGEWVENEMPLETARAYAELTEKTMQRDERLAALPLPGRGEYLKTLDEAVQSAVRGEQKPADALRHAAEKWNEISQRLGLEKQKAAYRHSMGL